MCIRDRERYNAKQIRSDRKIKDYYEKIRSSKQEKPFHEIILQVGGKGNMNAEDVYKRQEHQEPVEKHQAPVPMHL